MGKNQNFELKSKSWVQRQSDILQFFIVNSFFIPYPSNKIFLEEWSFVRLPRLVGLNPIHTHILI